MCALANANPGSHLLRFVFCTVLKAGLSHAWPADGSLMSDPLIDGGNMFSGGSLNATFVEDSDTFGRTLQCTSVRVNISSLTNTCL